ncbi:hypothetical protein CLOP_g20349 [Closterium sp. NIES-67]|nr:hypothetical protein CLOP_g20349 [Closterium sp. NIES-67]
MLVRSGSLAVFHAAADARLIFPTACFVSGPPLRPFPLRPLPLHPISLPFDSTQKSPLPLRPLPLHISLPFKIVGKPNDTSSLCARGALVISAAAAEGREGSTSPQERRADAPADAAEPTRRGRQRRRTRLSGGSADVASSRGSDLGSPQSSDLGGPESQSRSASGGGESGGFEPNESSRGGFSSVSSGTSRGFSTNSSGGNPIIEEWQGMGVNGSGSFSGGEGSAEMRSGGRRIGGGRAEGMSAARQRRLEKTREARVQRRDAAEEEFQEWASQVAAKDPELMEIFGDAMLDPQQMQEKMEERIRSKQAELLEEKRGSGSTMQVAIKEIDPFDMYIWFELHKTPSEDDMNTLGSVIRAWYVVGKLGGYNSANLQLMEGDESSKYKYNVGTAAAALPAMMHNVGDLEFQDNLGRIWLDMGTADMMAVDILLNSLNAVSSDHVGIKKVTVGGSKMDYWEEGMTRAEDGYQSYSI